VPVTWSFLRFLLLLLVSGVDLAGSFLISFLVGVFASALTATDLEDAALLPLLLEPFVVGSVLILGFEVSPFFRLEEDLPLLEEDRSFFLPFELDFSCWRK